MAVRASPPFCLSPGTARRQRNPEEKRLNAQHFIQLTFVDSCRWYKVRKAVKAAIQIRGTAETRRCGADAVRLQVITLNAPLTLRASGRVPTTVNNLIFSYSQYYYYYDELNMHWMWNNKNPDNEKFKLRICLCKMMCLGFAAIHIFETTLAFLPLTCEMLKLNLN